MLSAQSEEAFPLSEWANSLDLSAARVKEEAAAFEAAFDSPWGGVGAVETEFSAVGLAEVEEGVVLFCSEVETATVQHTPWVHPA